MKLIVSEMFYPFKRVNLTMKVHYSNSQLQIQFPRPVIFYSTTDRLTLTVTVTNFYTPISVIKTQQHQMYMQVKRGAE